MKVFTFTFKTYNKEEPLTIKGTIKRRTIEEVIHHVEGLLDTIYQDEFPLLVMVNKQSKTEYVADYSEKSKVKIKQIQANKK